MLFWKFRIFYQICLGMFKFLRNIDFLDSKMSDKIKYLYNCCYWSFHYRWDLSLRIIQIIFSLLNWGTDAVAYPEIGHTTLEESKVVIKVVKIVIFLYIDIIGKQFSWLCISPPPLCNLLWLRYWDESRYLQLSRGPRKEVGDCKSLR